MVPAGNKVKRLSSVNDTTKTIHHHHHHHHQNFFLDNFSIDWEDLLKTDELNADNLTRM